MLRKKIITYDCCSKLFSFSTKGSSIFNYNEQIQEIGAFHNDRSKSFCKINFDVVILDLKMKGAKKFKLVTPRHTTTVKRPESNVLISVFKRLDFVLDNL